jgi:hypothetical protein
MFFKINFLKLKSKSTLYKNNLQTPSISLLVCVFAAAKIKTILRKLQTFSKLFFKLSKSFFRNNRLNKNGILIQNIIFIKQHPKPKLLPVLAAAKINQIF